MTSFILLSLRRANSGAIGAMSKLQVNVNVTSDVVCPWCWIGKKHLDTAMHHLSDDFEFNVHWKPFLLNPYMPEEGMPIQDYLRLKFGEEAAERFVSGSSPVSQQGKAAGLTFTPNRLMVPTKKAHIILDYASEEGKQHELQEELFKAYFAEGKNITSDAVLKELASKAGLDVDKAMAAVKDSKASDRFEEAVKDSLRKGITGVPFFEISLKDQPDLQHQFGGAQPIETFVAVFSRLRTLSSKV